MISIFGSSSVELIKKLKIKEIKIPSHEVANKRLIGFAAKKFEKIYFSTGASNEKEIIYANKVFKKIRKIFI